MERSEIQQYHILETLSRDDGTTQRQLAERLGVSLGLVNSFMKSMLKKGYFKVSTLPARRVKYLLTPKGMAEKARLTLEYLDYSLGYYARVRKSLKRQIAGLVEDGVTRVALVGTNELAELAFISLRERGLEPAVVASGADLAPERFMGYKVVRLEELAGHEWQVALVAVTGRQHKASAKLAELGVEPGRIVFALEGSAEPVLDRGA